MCATEWVGYIYVYIYCNTLLNLSLNFIVNSFFDALFNECECEWAEYLPAAAAISIVNDNNTHFYYSLLLKIQSALKQITMLAHTPHTHNRKAIHFTLSLYLFGHMEIYMEDK